MKLWLHSSAAEIATHQSILARSAAVLSGIEPTTSASIRKTSGMLEGVCFRYALDVYLVLPKTSQEPT